MKSMILVTLATMGLFCTTSHAALSGYYDSMEKIKVALESPELADKMQQLPIESLSIQNEGSAIVIQSNGCGYAIHLKAQQPAGFGATTYSVESIVGPMCTGLAK